VIPDVKRDIGEIRVAARSSGGLVMVGISGGAVTDYRRLMEQPSSRPRATYFESANCVASRASAAHAPA
jgi:hypothetical protein